MKNNLFRKLREKKGEGQGNMSYNVISFIMIIILVALIAIPIYRTISSSGQDADDIYKGVYNHVIDTSNTLPTFDTLD